MTTTNTIKNTIIAILALVIIVMGVSIATKANTETKPTANTSETASLKNQLLEITKTNEMINKNLATFDELDYTVFSNSQWERLHESHSKDVKVHWPDGHMTTGIETHISDLKKLFVFAPDTRIKEHPIKIGQGNITAVMGYMEGTFTKPMPIGDGKFIEPTGKSFRLPMATIGLWGSEGNMTEEFLFWDNQTYNTQLGLK
jgi:SnoaL-like polyketide cyclase